MDIRQASNILLNGNKIRKVMCNNDEYWSGDPAWMDNLLLYYNDRNRFNSESMYGALMYDLSGNERNGIIYNMPFATYNTEISDKYSLGNYNYGHLGYVFDFRKVLDTNSEIILNNNYTLTNDKYGKKNVLNIYYLKTIQKDILKINYTSLYGASQNTLSEPLRMFRLKFTNVAKYDKILLYFVEYLTNEPVDHIPATQWITKDGEYTFALPKFERPEVVLLIPKPANSGGKNSLPLIIEQLPTYPGGLLLSSSSRTYIECTKRLPKLTDFTVICKRAIIGRSVGSVACLFDNSITNNIKNVFEIEKLSNLSYPDLASEISTEYNMNINSFGLVNRVFLNKNLITVISPSKYNSKSIVKGSTVPLENLTLRIGTNIKDAVITLGSSWANFTGMVLYDFLLFDKTLTTTEINEVLEYYDIKEESIYNNINITLPGIPSIENEIYLPVGKYKLECWGASGGYFEYFMPSIARSGAYCKGDLNLTTNNRLFAYIGTAGYVNPYSENEGKMFEIATESRYGGWNGTQDVETYIYGETNHNAPNESTNVNSSFLATPPGGSTDICLVPTTFYSDLYTKTRDIVSLNSRILCAAGSSGLMWLYSYGFTPHDIAIGESYLRRTTANIDYRKTGCLYLFILYTSSNKWSSNYEPEPLSGYISYYPIGIDPHIIRDFPYMKWTVRVVSNNLESDKISEPLFCAGKDFVFTPNPFYTYSSSEGTPFWDTARIEITAELTQDASTDYSISRIDQTYYDFGFTAKEFYPQSYECKCYGVAGGALYGLTVNPNELSDAFSNLDVLDYPTDRGGGDFGLYSYTATSGIRYPKNAPSSGWYCGNQMVVYTSFPDSDEEFKYISKSMCAGSGSSYAYTSSSYTPQRYTVNVNNTFMLTNSLLVDGEGVIPDPTLYLGTNIKGSYIDGYVRITLLS